MLKCKWLYRLHAAVTPYNVYLQIVIVLNVITVCFACAGFASEGLTRRDVSHNVLYGIIHVQVLLFNTEGGFIYKKLVQLLVSTDNAM